MNNMVGQRATEYRALLDAGKGPLGNERKPVFSPALSAQDASNTSRLYFHWNPIFIPYEFTHWLEESQAHTQTCYIGDWTAIGKLAITGPQAQAFLSHVGTVNLKEIAVGQAKHHVQVDDNGWIASEGIVYRTAEQHFVYTGGGTDWTAWQLGNGQWDAQAEDLSPLMFLYEIQGPNSLFTMERLFGQKLRDIGFNRSRTLDLDGVTIRVLRTGVSGELGYELHGPAEHATMVWARAVAAGGEFGIKELGMRSQLVAHIEAGIATAGIDYLPASIVTPGAQKLIPSGRPSGSFVPGEGVQDYFRYPHELGWGARVSLNSHEFIGRDALLRIKELERPVRRLMALQWNTDDVRAIQDELFLDAPAAQPMQLPRDISLGIDRVLLGNVDVGVSSSRTYSPTLRHMISLGVLEESVEPGTEVTVIWGSPGTPQREIRAIVRVAPIKPDRRRTDTGALPPTPTA